MTGAFPLSVADSGKERRMAVTNVGKKMKPRYRYDFRVDGVRYRGVLKKARTKSEADLGESKIIARVSEGWYDCKGKKRTLKSFIEEVYLPWSEVNKRSCRIDKSRVKPIVAALGQKALQEITVFAVEKFKSDRRNAPIIYPRKGDQPPTTKPRSVASVNRELCLLSKILSLAVKKKELKENPCRDVKLLSGERPRSRYLLPDEEDRLDRVLTGRLAHLRQIVDLYINTGVRANELLKLRVEALDFNRDVVHIDGEKGDKRREVLLNDTSRRIFQELAAEAKRKNYTHLFTNPRTGKPFAYLYHGWKKACELAGVKNLRIHDLRHTFGTRAADGGAPLTAIQALMGHKCIATTMQYTHATDEGKRRAVMAAESRPRKLVNFWSKAAVGEE